MENVKAYLQKKYDKYVFIPSDFIIDEVQPNIPEHHYFRVKAKAKEILHLNCKKLPVQLPKDQFITAVCILLTILPE